MQDCNDDEPWTGTQLVRDLVVRSQCLCQLHQFYTLGIPYTQRGLRVGDASYGKRSGAVHSLSVSVTDLATCSITNQLVSLIEQWNGLLKA